MLNFIRTGRKVEDKCNSDENEGPRCTFPIVTKVGSVSLPEGTVPKSYFTTSSILNEISLYQNI
jgi:hypothetical protein